MRLLSAGPLTSCLRRGGGRKGQSWEGKKGRKGNSWMCRAGSVKRDPQEAKLGWNKTPLPAWLSPSPKGTPPLSPSLVPALGLGSGLGARPRRGEPPARPLAPPPQSARPGRRSRDVRRAAAGPSASSGHAHSCAQPQRGWGGAEPGLGRGGAWPGRWRAQGRSGRRLRRAAFQSWMGAKKNFIGSTSDRYESSPPPRAPAISLALGGAVRGWVRVAVEDQVEVTAGN